VAKKRKRRLAPPKVHAAKQNIRREATGIVIVGLACLALVALFAEHNGSLGQQIRKVLTMIGGDGRIFLPLMAAAWGLAYMNRAQWRFGWRAAGVFLLWLVLVGTLHLQLPDADTLARSALLQEGKLGHGGGLAGAGVAIVLRATVGMPGAYVVLLMVALLGALLAVNRSLVGGLKELGRAGRGTGIWVKEQIEDLAYVIKNPERDSFSPHAPAQEGNEAGELSGRQGDLKRGFKAADGTRRSGAPTGNALDRGFPVTPLVIRTLADRAELAPGDSEESVAKSGRQLEFDDWSAASDPKNLPEDKAAASQATAGERLPAPGQVTGTPISRQARSDQHYQLPAVTLLQRPLKVKNTRLNKDLADNVRVLEETLESFGVRIKVTQVTQGPAITRYEAQPAPGVKVSRITNLADDIALSLASADVRIEAPIPGKSVVGIEVPNKEVAMVPLREVLETPEYLNAGSKLSLALGKDIAGLPVIADLAKMPHLLIAGATGSGKSVCINTLINSILFKAQPTEVKFLLVDPKMVELAHYNGIPHLIAPVVTDPKKAAGALKWIVTEMETRYELFASAGVRDIVRYNYVQTQEKGAGQPALPYVVVIIDELADLMMVAPGDVEDAICRLAQMARAAGIHLVVATQRPSVDVITGLIKANIPSRIAFAVSSQTDSRTILDMNGAEKLLGRGDMLYYPMGASKPIRVQGCYVGDKEVENVVKFLQSQAKPDYQEIPQIDVGKGREAEAEEMDELFHQAALLFMESGTASVSLLQRRFRIGYTRAARIVDQLEEKGVVGGYEGSKPREVLMTRGQFEQKFGPIKEFKAN